MQAVRAYEITQERQAGDRCGGAADLVPWTHEGRKTGPLFLDKPVE